MKKLIGGNWKANYDHSQLTRLSHLNKHTKSDVFIAVPFPFIKDAKYVLPDYYSIGAQDCSYFEGGSHTGEVSAKMLKDIGVEYVIIGHSERRAMGETDKNIREKLKHAISCDLKIVLCVGETLAEHEDGSLFNIVEEQLKVIPENTNLDVAYEPVWAIGTGKSAKKEEILEMAHFIKALHKNVSRVIYGGSVDQTNIDEIASIVGLDGVLVGGASLTNDFGKIIETYENLVEDPINYT